MPLTPDQRAALRAKLQQRRARMVADLREEAVSDEGTLAVRSHRGETDDDAVVEAMDAVEIAATARDANELAAIDRALQRLDTPEYGLCIHRLRRRDRVRAADGRSDRAALHQLPAALRTPASHARRRKAVASTAWHRVALHRKPSPPDSSG